MVPGAYDRGMFRNLLTRLFSDDDPSSQPLGGMDGEVAVAALMIRVARADDRYGEAERGRVEAILARRNGLTHAQAVEQRAAAEMIEAEAPDTVRLTRTIKQRVPLEHRIGIISALWEVALSDGERAPEEEAAVRLTAGLLGINDMESARARQLAAVELGPGIAS